MLVKNNKNLKEENINFKAIKTSGDLNLKKNISEIGGKHLFCKEIEESLLKKEVFAKETKIPGIVRFISYIFYVVQKYSGWSIKRQLVG